MYQLHIRYCVFFGTGDRGMGINETVYMDFNNIQLTKIVALPYLYFIQCLDRCPYDSEATV
jgi:hypothetical protein